MRLSLRTRILLLTIGAVVFCAALQGVGIQYVMRKQMSAVTHEDAKRTGLALAEYLRQQRNQLMAQSEFLAGLSLIRAVLGTDRATIDDALKDNLKGVGADALEATDESGKRLGFASDTETKSILTDADAVISSGVKEALEGRKWAGVATIRRSIVYVVVVPVSIHGYIKGSLIAFRRIDAGVANAFQRSIGIQVAFLANGRVVASSLPVVDQRIPISNNFWKITVHNEDYLALAQAFPDTDQRLGIGFAALRSYDSVTREFSPFTRLLAWGTVASLLLALVAGYAVAGSVLKPITLFVKAARTISSGQFPAPFNSERNDEIGLLMRTFDEMTSAMRDHQAQIKEGALATIQALAAAVDAKDPYTRGHSSRVAEYATVIAQALGMSDEEIEWIYTTGTLHDVGKIAVPDSILKKPGRLDDDERLLMEDHPGRGEEIIRRDPYLAPTLPGVRHHHERWDGKGYPDKLAGEDIPFAARILAVADTFDAMTSDRPYRKGLDIGIALNEIYKGAGTQFDPELALTFVEIMRQSAGLIEEAPEDYQLPMAA